MTAPLNAIREFLKLESAAGIVLMIAGALAVIVANSPLAVLYEHGLQVPLSLGFGAYAIDKPLLLWINDGLMALFFLLVGLELKRELLEGELAGRSQVVLPAAAALGGMIVPALIYIVINAHDATALRGWGVPVATDIAFALGVLALLGARVPPALKLLLLALATLDDLGAIVIIALFYTSKLSILALSAAGIVLAALALLNLAGVGRVGIYLLMGVVLWVCVLESGVHATLAGVVTAFAIPLHARRRDSPLRALEHQLHPWVAFGILPLFAFANTGIDLRVLGWTSLLEPIPLGIAAGLFFGKQIGVMLFAFLAIRLGFARLPHGSTWSQLYGVAIVCGIGFTMSLFIGSLAFHEIEGAPILTDRPGIILGSLLSAVAGYLWLRAALPRAAPLRHDQQRSEVRS